MLRNRAVLPFTTIFSAMRGDSVVIEENLYYLVGYPHIDLAFNVFVRDGV